MNEPTLLDESWIHREGVPGPVSFKLPFHPPRTLLPVSTISRSAPGFVVLIPSRPVDLRNSVDVAVIVFVPLKYGNCPVVPVYREEVAMESVEAEPPTNAPRVPVTVRPLTLAAEIVRVLVAAA
jgi:hypothetical protein